MRTALLGMVTLATGCFSRPEPTTFVAPLDGQTAVPLRAPLQLRTGWIGNPSGYPLPPELVTVVDLEDGGFVPGELQALEQDLVFVPSEPWREDASYAWVVSRPPTRARQPELDIPDAVLGEAVFHTGFGPELLDAVLDGDQLCLLLSEPTSYLPWETVTVGGVDVRVASAPTMDPSVDLPDLELLDGDPGAGAACIATPEGVGPGDVLRAGGVAVELDGGTLADALSRRHRLEVWE